MWIKDVNLPEPLLDAQKNESLVVFAGAGVSVGPPSNLPNFEQLASKVAEGALARTKGEPIDRFLGRLAKHGTKVHRRAWDILSDPNSKPTPLHHAILSLFRSAAAVRAITTNFDRHFSTVAAELFQDDMEVYYAPALPLSREFNGLVYLHGSVNKEPESLVLTDSDLGRAYLTDGWATRFLQEMFTKYVILFVGYSHDDPVMRYLARGLPTETYRYALTKPGQDEHWKFLGITPVTYPLKRGPNSHRALGKAVTAWVNFAKMGALDHEQRIRKIVESPPPLERETADYIKRALKELSKVRFFVRYARSIEWLLWLEGQQGFRSLFQTSEPVDEIAQEIAAWFAKHFVCEHPSEALDLVQRQGQRLNPLLWQAIASQLAYRNPRPDAGTLAQWVAVLLSPTPTDWRSYSINYLVNNCQYPKDGITALLLFEYLTRPRLKLKPRFSFPVEDSAEAEPVDAEIVVEGNEYWLEVLWGKIFQPNIAGFSWELRSILTSHLTQAHLLLCAIGKGDDRWDPLSFGRSAIEPHKQDRHSKEFDILIDAARDIIEWMLKYEPDQAHAVIEAWSTSGVPLLKRLAIHGITESLQIDPDEKVAWILERDLLYASGMKHETFCLLKKTYPKATEEVRVRLLERVNCGPPGQAAKNLKEETREYEIYNLLVWLHQVAPDCHLTAEHLEAMQEAHSSFKPRKHPDLYGWMSTGWEGSRSPLTVDELLAKNPYQEIDWLLTYRGDEFMGPNREGLLLTVTGTVARSFDWSWQLVTALQEKEEWSSDLWRSIFHGWQKISLAERQWREVLTLLVDQAQLYIFADTVAELLEKASRKEQGGLPSSCLSLAEDVANRLYDACSKESASEEELESKDWLGSAINHPGGKIAEFWLNALSKRAAEKVKSWTSLPLRYKEYFAKILTGESHAAQLGRVVLASQIHFLFALDSDWSRQNVLPLLDWSVDQRRAQQAWHGYLVWGRWNEAILAELLPLYEQTFPKLLTYLSNVRDVFCEDLASIAVYSSSNPVKDDWLRKFLLQADPVSHKIWASKVSHQLLSLKEESVRDLWNRWMDDYWSQRITGVPLPLSQVETEEMLLWAIPLEAVFPKVVEKICDSRAPGLKHTSFYRQLIKKKATARHPISLTRLLQHLLSNAYEPFSHCSELEQLVRGLVDSDAPHRELLLVCENLAGLGCPNAAKLKELIEGSNGD